MAATHDEGLAKSIGNSKNESEIRYLMILLSCGRHHIPLDDAETLACLARRQWLFFAFEPAWCHLYSDALIALDIKRRKLTKGNICETDPAVQYYWSERQLAEYDFFQRTGKNLAAALQELCD